MARHISLRLRCTLQDGVMAVFEDGYLLGTVDYKATPTEITEQTRLLWEASGGWTRAAIQNMSIATYHIVKVAAEEPDDQRNLRAMLAWSGAVNIEVEGDGPDKEPAEPTVPTSGGIGAGMPTESVISRARWAKQPDGTWAEVEKLPV